MLNAFYYVFSCPSPPTDYQFVCLFPSPPPTVVPPSGMAYKLINYIRYAAYFVFGLLH